MHINGMTVMTATVRCSETICDRDHIDDAVMGSVDWEVGNAELRHEHKSMNLAC